MIWKPLLGLLLVAGAISPAQSLQDAGAVDPVLEAASRLEKLEEQKLLRDRDYAATALRDIDFLRDSKLVEGEEAAALDYLRALALVGIRDLAKASEQARQLVVDHPNIPDFHFLNIGIVAQSAPKQLLAAIEAADRGLVSPDARTAFAENLNPDLLPQLFRAYPKDTAPAEYVQLRRSLLKLGFPPADLPQVRDNFRVAVIEDDLRQGRIAEARSTAIAVTSPDTVVGMIINKTFDPIIEGDRIAMLNRALTAFDAETDRLVRADPKDAEAAVMRAQLLRSVGKDQQALDLLLPFTRDMAAVEKGGKYHFWAVNEAGYTLMDLGRAPEAIALMEKLVALDVGKHPELISMAINMGEMLNIAGRHDDAIKHATRLEREGDKAASDFGRMWIWETLACGYTMSGDAAAAKPWLAKIAESEGKNKAAYFRTQLCTNNLEGAARQMIARLDGPDADRLLSAVQIYAKQKRTFGYERLLDTRFRAVVDRPDVQAAIAKRGRILTLPMAETYWGGV